jgi:hypothetical protein
MLIIRTIYHSEAIEHGHFAPVKKASAFQQMLSDSITGL